MKKSITLFKYIKLLSYLKKLQGLKASESLLDIFYLLYIASLSYKKTSKTSGMRVKKAKKRETCCFTSKELDEETGLYYFGARYYDAQISKWMSCDPILDSYLDGAPSGGVFDPINLNLYHYSHNNPIIYTDPNGLLNVAMHGGATGYYNPKKPGSGGVAMKGYTDMAKRVFGLKNDFDLPNFEYSTGKLFDTHSNYQEGYDFLMKQQWDKNGDNNLIGWSVGGDAVANFLADTNVKFKNIIIDAAQTKYLTADIIEKISKNNLVKGGKLIIIDHKYDPMENNPLLNLFDAGDRFLGYSDNILRMYTWENSNDEMLSLDKISSLQNVEHFRIISSHSTKQSLEAIEAKINIMNDPMLKP